MFGVLFLLVSRARGVHACIYMCGFQEGPEVFQLVVIRSGSILEELS